MSCRCIRRHTRTLSHAHRSHFSTHSFPSHTSSPTELGRPHRAFLQTGRVLEQTPRAEPIKAPAAWVRRPASGGWMDGAERPVWATAAFPYLSSPFLSSLFWVNSLPLPGCLPGAANCTSCTLRPTPPPPQCHRTPFAVGTRFQQSMAGAAKQSAAGLTAAKASEGRLFSTGHGWV